MVNQSPRILEADEIYKPLFPHEARLRNLTYSTEMYVWVSFKKMREITKGKDDKQGFSVMAKSTTSYDETPDGGIGMENLQEGDGRKFEVLHQF